MPGYSTASMSYSDLRAFHRKSATVCADQRNTGSCLWGNESFVHIALLVAMSSNRRTLRYTNPVLHFRIFPFGCSG